MIALPAASLARAFAAAEAAPAPGNPRGSAPRAGPARHRRPGPGPRQVAPEPRRLRETRCPVPRVEEHLAPEEREPGAASDPPPLVERVAGNPVVFGGADLPVGVGVDHEKIGVGPHLDRALVGPEPEDPRGVLGEHPG